MSTFPEELRAHLAGDCTTVCHCWRVSRRDRTSFGFTDHDWPLTVAGQIYEPETGLAQSEARATMGMATNTVDVEGALSSERISEADIAAGLYDGATVDTMLVNWRQPDQFALLRRAVIGRIVRADGQFMAELESVAASLDRPAGRHLRRTCDAVLGDARCGMSLADARYRGTGSVGAIVAPGTVRVSGLGAFAGDWFSNGRLSWTSGALAGRSATVVSHRASDDGATIVLPAGEAMPAPGDAFTIAAGCDRQFSTCRAKFANQENFRGFPHLPGNDAAYRYVTEGGQFDGGAIVP